MFSNFHIMVKNSNLRDLVMMVFIGHSDFIFYIERLLKYLMIGMSV